MAKSQNIHQVLTAFMRERHLEAKMLEQKVFGLWQEHLGEPLGTKTMPVSLSEGVLKVYTEHPIYTTELSSHKPQLLTDLNAKLGRPVLKDLRIEFRPREVQAYRTEASRSSQQRSQREVEYRSSTATPEQLARIEQTLATVSDTALKRSLSQLFLTQSSKRK